ncbi:MAG TPA: hypothetical protein P5228_03225 [Bacteroidales bacterium]|nr:hypothetical protein [Bacteroidales bacterium]HRZ49536.1 hypothetical protein [Bacteroidales bacterium]
MSTNEQTLRDFLIGKQLKDIEFWDTDLKYISPNIDNLWIIDGGIELNIDDDFFSFAWSESMEMFMAYPLRINEYNKEVSFAAMGAREVAGIENLIWATITEVSFVWNFYFKLNDEGEPVWDKKLIPNEIVLYFSNDSFLQIAAIDYQIQCNKLEELTYCSEGELLISLNKKINIKDLQ